MRRLAGGAGGEGWACCGRQRAGGPGCTPPADRSGSCLPRLHFCAASGRACGVGRRRVCRIIIPTCLPARCTWTPSAVLQQPRLQRRAAASRGTLQAPCRLPPPAPAVAPFPPPGAEAHVAHGGQPAGHPCQPRPLHARLCRRCTRLPGGAHARGHEHIWAWRQAPQAPCRAVHVHVHALGFRDATLAAGGQCTVVPGAPPKARHHCDLEPQTPKSQTPTTPKPSTTPPPCAGGPHGPCQRVQVHTQGVGHGRHLDFGRRRVRDPACA